MTAARETRKIDKTILDNFYKLVHSQANIRLTAASSTYKILAAMQKTKLEAFNEHLNYCVDRLVTGLSSDRALARQGYGTLLLELLNTYQISTDRLLSIARQKFGINFNQMTRDELLGYFLLVAIILESGNYKRGKSSDQYLEKLYKFLNQLKHSKSYFVYPVTRIFTKYYDLFHPQYLTDIPYGFDDDSKTNKITDLISMSTPTILKRYADKLFAMLEASYEQKDPKATQSACVRQLAFIISRPQMAEDEETSVRFAKYLLASTFFRLTNRQDESTIWSDNNIMKPIDLKQESVRISFRKSYHAALDHIVSCPKGLQRAQQLGALVDFSNQLLNHESVKLVDPNLQKSVPTLWSQYVTALDKHRKFTKKHDESTQSLPITNLFLFYGLQIIEHGLDCTLQLEELAQSAVESCTGDPSDGSWADVLTDQLIAILSATECNPWIRTLCVRIFGSLLPHISETSIDLLCDALKTPFDDEGDCEDGESASASDEDEDEDEAEDDGDEDEDDDDDDGSDSNDEEERSSCDDSEQLMEVDSETGGDDSNETENGGTCKAAKRSHPDTENDEAEVADDDDNDDDEEYMTDEQMFKLDGVLADMFRLKSTARKRRRDPAFKLRCLDLIKKVVARKHKDTELMKKILMTLVPLASSSRKMAETRPLADKIEQVIKKIKPSARGAAL